ncbi:MAG TPA: hypothetical protein VK943_05225 [Arenibaculum sp.]|nr:hypothetical protein [Arenibaculum sp.]
MREADGLTLYRPVRPDWGSLRVAAEVLGGGVQPTSTAAAPDDRAVHPSGRPQGPRPGGGAAGGWRHCLLMPRVSPRRRAGDGGVLSSARLRSPAGR